MLFNSCIIYSPLSLSLFHFAVCNLRHLCTNRIGLEYKLNKNLLNYQAKIEVFYCPLSPTSKFNRLIFDSFPRGQKRKTVMNISTSPHPSIFCYSELPIPLFVAAIPNPSTTLPILPHNVYKCNLLMILTSFHPWVPL